MKKRLAYICLAAALLAGCSNEEPADAYPQGMGRIAVRCGADRTVDTRAFAVPGADDFSLTLSGDDYTESWPTVAAFAAEEERLFREGTYTATIAWGDPEAEGPDRPCFRGEVTTQVKARRVNTIEIEARIANSQTRVAATEQFLRYFHDAEFTVTTGAGNKFVYTPAAGREAEPVFVQAGTTLTVTGTARQQSQTGQTEGPLVTFPAQRLDAAAPRTCHTFLFDAPDAGSATLTIYLGDDEAEVVPIDLEMNDDAIE